MSGIDGYVRFLKGINGDYDDSGSLEWAKSLGWSKRVSRPENML